MPPVGCPSPQAPDGGPAPQPHTFRPTCISGTATVRTVERDVTLLANPAAGRGRAAGLLESVRTRLASSGHAVDVAQGSDADESLELARKAVERGTDAVVVLGGDGICHLALQAVAGTTVPLGIVPAGTGNDFAEAIGVPQDPHAAVDAVLTALARKETRGLDAVRTGQRWWGSVLCAGFDSAVNERANSMRWPRGPRRYDLAILAELARLRPRPFTLTLDGEEWQVDATLVAVGNGHRYGAGLQICPQARMDDGLLDVTVVGPVSRIQLVRFKPWVRRGTHGEHPAVTFRRAREVSLAAPGVSAYADGERIADLPVTATCVSGALRVLLPAASAA